MNSKTQPMLPLFEEKELTFSFKSHNKSYDWSESTKRLMVWGISLPFIILAGLVMVAITSLIPGLSDFLNDESNKAISVLVGFVPLLAGFLLAAPYVKKVEQKKLASVQEHLKADGKRLVEVIREHGYEVPAWTDTKNVSYVVFTDLETGVEYRASGFYNGNQVTVFLRVD